jgi:hypothetical protein
VGAPPNEGGDGFGEEREKEKKIILDGWVKDVLKLLRAMYFCFIYS